ncbi:hypothetical protein [Streptococcus parauberis]|uniref:hypothetical protein n=1 Tax=Streptococcus parauberis TaxID=1348 RepID=UPI0021562894|nr:hypothetical protein [Streptococcus parauberis]
MIALDGTREIVLTPKHLEYIKHINPEMAEFIRLITASNLSFTGNKNIGLEVSSMTLYHFLKLSFQSVKDLKYTQKLSSKT